MALLGSGGLGDVYRARDTRLERDVALKVLRPRGFGDKSADRLLREARAAATLDHPNAVRVFDVGEIDGLTFLAMELIDGKPLRAFIGDETIAMDRRLSWLVQIASALEAAHREGIVHRDVKPDNVMVRSDGVVKVVDFGIAHIDDSEKRTITISRAGIAIGTPAYMAPEQLRGGPVDGRTDQFAWGVVAFELIEGVRPWHSGNSAESVARILSADVPELKNASPEVAWTVRRCLAKRPVDRFESMSEVVLGLRAASRLEAKNELPSRWMEYRLTVVGFVALALFGILDPARMSPRSGRTRTERIEVPASPNTPASALFDAAMIDFREGSIEEAQRDFERLSQVGPHVASAHLWAALLSHDPDEKMRSHLQRALQSRAELGEFDRNLLRCAEPWLHAPTAWADSESCLEQLVEKSPNNVVSLFLLGWVRWRKDDFRGAMSAFDRSIALDPRFGPSQFARADVALLAGDQTAFANALRSCTEDAPASTGCLRLHAYNASATGQCDIAEDAALRLVTLAPETPRWYRSLANNRFSRSGNVAEAEPVLARAVANTPIASREAARLEFEMDLAILAGDLSGAVRTAHQWEQSLATSTDQWEHMRASRAQWYLAIETGEPAEATKIANAYLNREAAWAQNDFNMDASVFALGIKYLVGSSNRATFRIQRDVWLHRERARARSSGASEYSPLVWFVAYAQMAKDGVDAQEALDELSKYQPLWVPLERGLGLEREFGRVHALAGRLSEATASLRIAAASCERVNFPRQHTWALLELAELLERQGQQSEACLNYRRVVVRWGKESTSVSAQKARLALRRLQCDG